MISLPILFPSYILGGNLVYWLPCLASLLFAGAGVALVLLARLCKLGDRGLGFSVFDKRTALRTDPIGSDLLLGCALCIAIALAAGPCYIVGNKALPLVLSTCSQSMRAAHLFKVSLACDLIFPYAINVDAWI